MSSSREFVSMMSRWGYCITDHISEVRMWAYIALWVRKLCQGVHIPMKHQEECRGTGPVARCLQST